MTAIQKLVSGLVALMVAFIMTFVVQDSTLITTGVTVLSALFGMWGVTDFRKQLDGAITLMQSKTKQGAVAIGIGFIILALLGYFNVQLPSYIIEGLKYLVEGLSIYTVMGANHAMIKNPKKAV